MATKSKQSAVCKKQPKKQTKAEQKPQDKSKIALNIVQKRLSDLKHAPYNPRKITESSFRGLNKSIERFGYVDPIIYNKRTGNIVGGHRRFDALIKQNNGENITVDVVELDIEEREEKALNVTLNNTQIMGDWDMEKLPDLLVDIKASIPDLEFEELRLDLLDTVEEKVEQEKKPKKPNQKIELKDIETIKRFIEIIDHFTPELKYLAINERIDIAIKRMHEKLKGYHDQCHAK